MRRSLILAMLLAVVGVASGAAAAPCTLRPTTATKQAAVSQSLAVTLPRARLATAKYATNLAAAKAAGYGIITKMIPDMGFHFMNPKITRFDATKPPILVYLKRGSTWQLGALEWVFPSKPGTPPLPGAKLRRVPGRLPLRRRHVRARRVAGLHARRRRRGRERRSASGTRTSSRCTCGSGTRIRMGSTPA